MFIPITNRLFVARLLWLLGLAVPTVLAGQHSGGQSVHGHVYRASDPPLQPLAFAEVVQLGTKNGVLSDAAGYFRLSLLPNVPHVLVVRAEGYQSDTLELADNPDKLVVLKLTPLTEVSEVTVSTHRQSRFLQSHAAQQSEQLTSAEFTKAACCNLGESFETNPSVDASYSDAVSGAKSITLLGLNGIYTNLLVEGLPWFNGLGRTFGLSYVPGPWLGSVQIAKGTGPASLGFETLTGQINLEFKRSEDERTLYNLFFNDYARTEANFNHHFRLGERWQGTLLLHGSTVPTHVDRNDDGFLDVPLTDQGNVLLKFRYQGTRGFEGQFALQALNEDRKGGQEQYYTTDDPALRAVSYGLHVQTLRIAYFSKTGYVWAARPFQSLGLQTSGVYHDQTGSFGVKTWRGLQRRWTGNLIFQSVLSDTRHQYRLGISYLYDQYDEYYNGADVGREESVPGGFAEYTYLPTDRFTAVAGIRTDFHNRFGTFLLPRLHLRYQISKAFALRAALGRGMRTANPFADNPPTLSSNRAVVIEEPLRPEVGWNTGGSLVYAFEVGLQPASLVIDYYHTRFENQVIADYDRNPQGIFLSNLDGRSRANAFQAELSFTPMRLLEAKLAYKFYDVRAPFNGKPEQVMLTPRHRGLVNLAYRRRNWRLDYTLKLIGSQRLHSFAEHHPGFPLRQQAPGYTLSDAQITFLPSEKWEIYLGGENLLGFQQPQPIIAAEDPLGPFFDTSYVWGPVLGRVVYLGLRVTVPSAND